MITKFCLKWKLCKNSRTLPCSGPSIDLLIIPSVVPSGLTLPSLCHSIPWWTWIPNLDFLWLPYSCLASVQKMSWALPALPFGLTSLLVSAIPAIGLSLYFSRNFFSFGWYLWNLPMNSQLPLPVLILWAFGCSAVWSKNMLPISFTNVLTKTLSQRCALVSCWLPGTGRWGKKWFLLHVASTYSFWCNL